MVMLRLNAEGTEITEIYPNSSAVEVLFPPRSWNGAEAVFSTLASNAVSPIEGAPLPEVRVRVNDDTGFDVAVCDPNRPLASFDPPPAGGWAGTLIVDGPPDTALRSVLLVTSL